MSDHDDRADILRMDGYLIGIATLGLINGQDFSPLFDGAHILLRPFWPTFLPTSPLLLFYFSSLILAVGTVLIGGIGAAVYERAKGLEHSTPRSMQLWLLGTFALTIPAIGRLFKIF
ncbi:MAG: hypothetical protein ACRCTD_08175 [Beijerinckiaceae bacterium]